MVHFLNYIMFDLVNIWINLNNCIFKNVSQFTKALNNTYELPDWLKDTNETTDPLIGENPARDIKYDYID